MPWSRASRSMPRFCSTSRSVWPVHGLGGASSIHDAQVKHPDPESIACAPIESGAAARHRDGASRAALSLGPARAGAPPRPQVASDQAGSPVAQTEACLVRHPCFRLSSSRQPRQWRPCGPVARDRLRRTLTR
jgi:hypothetical protein